MAIVSKSRFKPHALEYFRQVQQTGEELIITDQNKPVLKIVPYSEDPMAGLQALRNTVLEYQEPLEPVGEEEWKVLSDST